MRGADALARARTSARPVPRAPFRFDPSDDVKNRGAPGARLARSCALDVPRAQKWSFAWT
jgi:hypothetical protein